MNSQTTHLLIRLQRQLARFDDQALIALSNKGLLRRASKDLEAAAPQVIESEPDLRVQVGEVIVTMPLTGPTQAQCSCPATGICRHILTVCLWLRSAGVDQDRPAAGVGDPAAQPGIPDPGTELASGSPQLSPLDLSVDQIKKWASKPRLQKATQQLATGVRYQIEGGEPLIVRFVDLNITCRYFFATGLEGMICSCKTAQVCVHRVMAILAYRQQQGIELDLSQLSTTAQQGMEAPRSREQVIGTAQQLLAEAIAVGILHLSEATQQRWVTLAVSAQGVNLHRLGLALRGLADQLGLSLQRDAKADEEQLFGSMAQVYALCQALLQSPQRADLVGEARSQYVEVGHLELIGMGAYHWQSPSGYAGLTVLFWDPVAQDWCTWSEARPQFHDSRFDPVARYGQAGPWSGISSPAEAARGRIKLLGAKRNRHKRLSSAKQTQGICLGPTSLECVTDQFPVGQRRFEEWSQLRHYLAETLPMGLQESDPNGSLVLIRPTAWGERHFDPIHQRLLWELEDPQGQGLILQVPYRSVDQHRIQALEALDPVQAQVWGLVGRAFVGEAGLGIYPLSLLVPSSSGQSAVLPLSFPTSRSGSSATLPSADPHSETDELTAEPQEDLEGDLDLPASAIDHQITALLERLQILAEGGSHRLTEDLRTDLRQQVQLLDQAGLGILARQTQTLLEAGEISQPILRLRYLCQIARQGLAKAQLL